MKIKSLLLILILCVSGLIISCEKDESITKEESLNTKLIGVWDNVYAPQSIKFNDSILFLKGKKDKDWSKYGIYKLSKDSIFVTNTEGRSYKYTYQIFGNTKLMIDTVSYKKSSILY